MTPPDRLQSALARLSTALRHLEAAATRRAEIEAGRADQDEEFLILQDDRSRLAVELDGALARSRALLAANTEVAARLDRVRATTAAVLGRLDPTLPPDPGGGPAEPNRSIGPD